MPKSKLSYNELFINEENENSAQKITGFDTTISQTVADNSKIPTSQAVINYFNSSELNHNS